MINFFVNSEKYMALNIFFLNIFIYLALLLTIFCIFFLFSEKTIITLFDLKNIVYFPFLNVSLLLVLFSMAGLPPLIGFCVKFLTFVFFFIKEYTFFYLFLTGLNIFYLFFYAQNIRFLIKKQHRFYVTNSLNFSKKETTILYICILNVLNILGIFFLEDFLTGISYFSCFIL